jgi:hypothetical protein
MPAVPQIDDALLQEFESADVLLFDGTFWSDDELIRIQGSGRKPPANGPRSRLIRRRQPEQVGGTAPST